MKKIISFKNLILFSILLPILTFAENTITINNSQQKITIPKDPVIENIFGNDSIFSVLMLKPMAYLLDYGSKNFLKSISLIITAFVFLELIVMVVEHFVKDDVDAGGYFNHLAQKIVTISVINLIVFNWYDGIGIYSKIIRPLMFQKLPDYLIQQNAITVNGIWDSLMSAPTAVLIDATKLGATIGIFDIFGIKLALIFILLIISTIMFFMVINIYMDMLAFLIKLFILTAFSVVMFIFSYFKPLKEKYGLSVYKTLLAVTIEMILVGAAFKIFKFMLDYIYNYSFGGKVLMLLNPIFPFYYFIKIALYFLIVIMFKKLLQSMDNIIRNL